MHGRLVFYKSDLPGELGDGHEGQPPTPPFGPTEVSFRYFDTGQPCPQPATGRTSAKPHGVPDLRRSQAQSIGGDPSSTMVDF